MLRHPTGAFNTLFPFTETLRELASRPVAFYDPQRSRQRTRPEPFDDLAGFESADLVTPRTLERIRAAIEETGFRPNAVAQSLRTSKTRTVGLLVADISNWFFGLIVESVEDAARLHGYSVLVCNAKEERTREEKALELLRARKVSGVINCSTGASIDSIRAFQRRGIPLVELDRRSGLDSRFDRDAGQRKGGQVGRSTPD